MNKYSRSLLDTTNDTIDNDTRQIGIQTDLSSDSDDEELGNVEVVGETTNYIEESTGFEQLNNASITDNPPDSPVFDNDAYLNSIEEKEALNKTLTPNSDLISRRAGLRTDSGVIHTVLTGFRKKAYE